MSSASATGAFRVHRGLGLSRHHDGYLVTHLEAHTDRGGVQVIIEMVEAAFVLARQREVAIPVVRGLDVRPGRKQQ